MENILARAKPCPFCGEQRMLELQEKDFAFSAGVTVRCQVCCSAGPMRFEHPATIQTQIAAIESWNERAKK